MKITEIAVKCPVCGWTGQVIDAEPDVDGEGSLGCPDCFPNIVIVLAEIRQLSKPYGFDP